MSLLVEIPFKNMLGFDEVSGGCRGKHESFQIGTLIKFRHQSLILMINFSAMLSFGIANVGIPRYVNALGSRGNLEQISHHLGIWESPIREADWILIKCWCWNPHVQFVTWNVAARAMKTVDPATATQWWLFLLAGLPVLAKSISCDR